MMTGDETKGSCTMRSVTKGLAIALAASLALSAVAVASAAAAAEWYVKKGGVFEKVKEPLNVEGTANWEVTDKVSILARFGVKCTSKDFGQIKPAGLSALETISEISCKPVKGCEKIESVGEKVIPTNLPWKLELY